MKQLRLCLIGYKRIDRRILKRVLKMMPESKPELKQESNQENTASLIIEGNERTFINDVVEASKIVPILVDFWAVWCEPCKTLIPALEKEVLAAGGAVKMVKLDIDQNQQIASQMQIRSVPTVIMFKNGQPVDAFAGIKNNGEIREFIAKHADKLPPSPEEELQAHAFALLEEEQFKEAGNIFAPILQNNPENKNAAAGLITCFLKLKDYENAGLIIEGLDPKIATKPEILALKAELETAQKLGELGDKKNLEEKIIENNDNFQARMDLSHILWAENDRSAAAEQLLYIIAKDREFLEDGARKQLLKFFEIAGAMDEFTVTVRKKLSILLFS